MHHPALPTGAFVAAFLILITAHWHWPTGRISSLSLIAWLFITNFIYGINSLAWSDDVQDITPVWCDISTKLIVGASVGIPACNLCISRHLAMIRGPQIIGMDDRGHRRIFLFDLGFCWVVPMIFMALHYIVQGHRYDIIQSFGCSPATYVSIPAIFIVWIPPLLLSVGSSVYAGIALYHFVRSSALSSNLRASGSMSISQYKRLMAMSITLMVLSTALTSFVIWAAIRHGLRPWVGWKRVHSHWSRVDVFPWKSIDPESRWTLLMSWWAVPVSTVVSFIFLGFGEDAVQGYRKLGEAIVRMIPSKVLPKRLKEFRKGTVRPRSGSSFGGPSAALPTIAPETNRASREPSLTQPFRFLHSVMGLLHSKAQSSGESNEQMWSAGSGKVRPAPSQSDYTGGGLYNSASGMGTTTVAEPQGGLMKGSVQGVAEVRGPRGEA